MQATFIKKILNFNQTNAKEDQECNFNSIGLVDLR